MASADAEGRQPLGEFVAGVDAGDAGVGRAVLAPRLEGGDGVRFAFDDDLDGAVRAVAGPAGHAQPPGLALARIPVPDSLDPSSHHETSTDRHPLEPRSGRRTSRTRFETASGMRARRVGDAARSALVHRGG